MSTLIASTAPPVMALASLNLEVKLGNLSSIMRHVKSYLRIFGGIKISQVF
jgi:hypothetical protein